MDILLALALVLALAIFGTLCVARALFPCNGLYLMVLAQGDGENLQEKLYALMWLRGLGLLSCPIYLVNRGLSSEGLLLVEHLSARWPQVSLWTEGDSFTSKF